MLRASIIAIAAGPPTDPSKLFGLKLQAAVCLLSMRGGGCSVDHNQQGAAQWRNTVRQLHNSQGTMLGVLVLKTVQNIGRNMPVLAEDNTITTYCSARVKDILLLEKPSDAQSPRRIDCYSIGVEDFDAAMELWKVVGFKYKIDPQRILFRIEYCHNAKPPDLKLQPLQDPALWFDRVGITLLGELCNCEPQVRDQLPPSLYCAAVAARGR